MTAVDDPDTVVDRRLRALRAEERRRRDHDAERDARTDALVAEALAERARTTG